MRKVYCDICGADLTYENANSIYRLTLDRDGAPFDMCIDIPEVCEDCAAKIKTSVHALFTEEAERRETV